MEVTVEKVNKISIHAPAKGATSQSVIRTNRIKFQSTLPRRERLGELRPSSRLIIDFNPRSREGSDNTIVDITTAANNISIHAPAKGATLEQ